MVSKQFGTELTHRYMPSSCQKIVANGHDHVHPTWRWPYDNIPTKFSGKFKDMNYNEIRLKEHEWKYLKGSTSSFEKCFNEIAGHDYFKDQNCHSIFDPNSFKYEKRYFYQTCKLNHRLLQNCYFWFLITATFARIFKITMLPQQGL